MAGRGLRSVLQPVLFLGIASLLHALLFLIPAGEPGKRDPETSRGIRVKTYVEGPAASAPRPAAAITPAVPVVTGKKEYSVPGADRNTAAGAPRGGESGSEGGPYGSPGPSQGPVVANGGVRARTAWDVAMEKIGSDETRGWARQSAQASRRGWRGTGAGSGGWGAGSGSGTGSGEGAGSGTGRGGGGGGEVGVTYLDPRVRTVILQYPIDEDGNTVIGRAKNIEGRFRPVPYPDLKVKKSRFTSGWWNVYIEVWTSKEGRIEKYNVLRPETRGAQEKVFIDQVTREMERWTFEPGRSEVHVDVRFHVE